MEKFELELGARAFNALRSAGLSTLEEVAAYSPDELRTIRNLGSKSMARIAATLEQQGLSERQNKAQPSSPHTTALDARTADILSRRTAGETLAMIADTYGITRERVRQILNRIGFDRQAAAATRLALQDADAEAHREEILRAFRRGESHTQTAHQLGLGKTAVQRLLDRCLTPTDQAVRRSNRFTTEPEKRFNDEDLIAAVREVGERYGRTPTTGEYQRAAANGVLPGIATIHSRIGWREAIVQAGFSPRPSKRRYSQHWTPEACRHALRRLVIETGEVPTAAQYDALAQLDDTLPSLATVRNRLGRWSTTTAEMARLPTRAEALSGIPSNGDKPSDSPSIWMGYLEEKLSNEDMIVLLISGDLIYSEDFGPSPPEFKDTIAQIRKTSPPAR